ncbi:Hypothetical predicted protein [Scomber scombrus]|uniref:Uncharacterized protein n=1 Tax=Scomber scombrus TaxID=13677 RepID=A0AAV1PLD5_SCOSC
MGWRAAGCRSSERRKCGPFDHRSAAGTNSRQQAAGGGGGLLIVDCLYLTRDGLCGEVKTSQSNQPDSEHSTVSASVQLNPGAVHSRRPSEARVVEDNECENTLENHYSSTCQLLLLFHSAAKQSTEDVVLLL